MSGSDRAYEPLRQTEREVDGQRVPGQHRNYEALRQTEQQVDARPQSPQQQQQQARGNPYEQVDERKAAYSQELDALVASGRINGSEKVWREGNFESEIKAEQIKFDKLTKARELSDAAKTQNAQQQQKENELGRAQERDGAER